MRPAVHARIEELRATGQLPSPTGVALEILHLTSKEETGPEELAKVLKADPAMTARLLKYANSAQQSARKAVTTVREAVVRLGFRTVRQLALSFSLLSNCRKGPCKAFQYSAYWSRSLARAVAAKVLAERYRSLAPDEAFTCGLLGAIGALALASVHPEEYARILEEHKRNPGSNLYELEREAFVIDHCELTACLLRDWKVPADLVNGVYHAARGEPQELLHDSAACRLAWCLQLGELCASVMVADDMHRLRMVPALLSVAQKCGIPKELLCELYDKILVQWRDWGNLLEVETKESRSLLELLEQREEKSTEQKEEETGRSPEVARKPAKEDRTEESQQPIRVLVVDDSELDRRLLQRILKESGYSVSVAEHGRVALRKALEERPQIIITDWLMPEMDGISFCKALRQAEAAREIYIIVLTGCEDEEHLVTAFEAGADDYVVKPFRPRMLKARMRAARRIVELQQKVARDREKIERYAAQLGIANRRLEQTALTDQLTGLPNRRSALQELDALWAGAKRHNRVFSCMLVDIDHFKVVNDTYGHDIGDAVLKETARCLRGLVRRDDMVCRFGGEEFLVICNETGRSGAENLGKRLCRGVGSHRIHAGRFQGTITISVGVASFSSKLASAHELLKQADEALYAAKRAGRNRVCVAPPA